MVGIGPINNPDIASNIERESKINLSCKLQGVSISTMPINPITIPAIILKSKVLNMLFLAHK